MRIVLLAMLLASAGLVTLAPATTADIVVPIYLCDLEGHCICREVVIRTPTHDVGRRCSFD